MPNARRLRTGLHFQARAGPPRCARNRAGARPDRRCSAGSRTRTCKTHRKAHAETFDTLLSNPSQTVDAMRLIALLLSCWLHVALAAETGEMKMHRQQAGEP